MFFLFPFGILLPLLFIFVFTRIGTRIYREYFKNREEGNRLSADESGGGALRSGFKNLRMRNPLSVEARIFRLAYKLKGRVTISDVVVDIGLDIRTAEETMNALVDGFRVQMEVDERGLVVYEFPEILARFEGS
jgi:hypothetical protein